mmetsp:Transcript_18919/g.60483  ORF Transcript_18919/g.60483 Transcript_18919/m.60483 type:complete len:160 (+) Transcript_18919:102-581(+)
MAVGGKCYRSLAVDESFFLARAAMAIVGLGVDLVHVPRIARAWARFGGRFAARFLHPDERAALQALQLRQGADEARVAQWLAGRWAAKEAAYKALGPSAGPARTLFTELQVLSGSAKQPLLELHGTAAATARARGVKRSHLSLSHDGEYAFAQVILESG